MDKKTFWRSAAEGGTVIGMAMAGIQLLHDAVPTAAYVMWCLHYVVFIGLIYGFTRNVARKTDATVGFGYGRALGFVLAMMLFTGILMGCYQFIAARTFMHEAMLVQIDQTMDIYAQMPMFASQMDGMYDMVSKMTFSPVVQIFAGILGYAITGLFFGLFTSAFVRRTPSPFGNNVNN